MAISLTSGLAIRKLSVTPSGTPAATNPMNAGTALHEQNGVATPSAGGHHVADALPAPTEQSAGAFDAHVGPQDGDHEDDPRQQQADLDGVVEEEVQGRGQPVLRRHAEHVVEHDVPHTTVDPVRREPHRRQPREETGSGPAS